VYFTIPSRPWRRPTPDAFHPPMGASKDPHAAAKPSLTLAVPTASRRASSDPCRGVDQIAAFSPYSESFARAIASASSRTR